jgi:DNA-binding MarR family transcriptional regulator
MRETSKSSKSKLIPKKKAKISPMAQQLGIVSKKEFEILQKIDGKKTISDIALELNQDLDDTNGLIQKLIEKGMLVIESQK